MFCSSACSSNLFFLGGWMRRGRLPSSSCFFPPRHTSTTTLIPPLSMPTSAPAHSSGYASLAWSWICSRSPAPILSGNLLLPESLGGVLFAPIEKDGANTPRLYLPRDLECRRDRRAGREADEDYFLAC